MGTDHLWVPGLCSMQGFADPGRSNSCLKHVLRAGTGHASQPHTGQTHSMSCKSLWKILIAHQGRCACHFHHSCHVHLHILCSGRAVMLRGAAPSACSASTHPGGERGSMFILTCVPLHSSLGRTRMKLSLHQEWTSTDSLNVCMRFTHLH